MSKKSRSFKFIKAELVFVKITDINSAIGVHEFLVSDDFRNQDWYRNRSLDPYFKNVLTFVAFSDNY